jgi:DNA repair protein RecO (recombination protein O)
MYTKYTGVILKKYPIGEADELLTIFTREAGKIRVKAVGSRKIKSRLAGSLQSLNEIEFETAGRRFLPVLISVRSRTLNNYLRENLKKFAHALVGIETLYRLTSDEEENPQLYELLLDFLKSLGNAARSEKLALRHFQLKLLGTLGFGPPPDLREEQGKEIDLFLENLMEREIKSKNFLNSL